MNAGFKNLKSHDNIDIIISDTGVGIPRENIPYVFDPFFTTKEIGEGTGLGLNMAYNIINKHNGKINIDSVVGEGTTFIITIPIDGITVNSTDN